VFRGNRLAQKDSLDLLGLRGVLRIVTNTFQRLKKIYILKKEISA
jgi:hypothetical protein